ncbi:MAG: hypothetical protein K1X89_24340 [Myxococcaceae bacterium]|nr:hypothetical protein [Myxococcaceae bacterium]
MRACTSSLVLTVLLAACGSLRAPSSSSSALALSLGDPVTVEAGQTLLVQVVVLGANGRDVSLAGQSLPSFASVSGHQLRLAPDRGVAPGEYPVSLTATAGAETVTSTLAVTVTRANTPPTLGEITFFEDGHPKCSCFYGDFGTDACRFASQPEVECTANDAENDGIRFEFELRDAGSPLLGVATHSIRDPYDARSGVRKRLPLDGLAAGGTYTLAIRVCDDFGGCVTPKSNEANSLFFHSLTSLDGGWMLVGVVSTSPAAPGCQHGATGERCSANGDCCSGSCDLSTTTPVGPGAFMCDEGRCN